MTVTVTVLDVNDNQPAFNYATVPEYTTVSSSILQVQATHVDGGDNGVVKYTISRWQSDKDGYFVEDRRDIWSTSRWTARRVKCTNW